jgi:hypothetical protein
LPGLSRVFEAREGTMLRSAIRLACFALSAAAIAAAAGSVTARAAPTVQNCGTYSYGPAAEPRGAANGAKCLLHAYQEHCRAAVYVLSSFGVDTVATDRFRLVRDNGRCVVTVAVSFQVVPQPARKHSGACRTLALKSTHVVAGRCTGASIPASIVLDPRPQ